ncbi:MAG: 16S rRNA (guanine(527)-N(7))-methyltransferase RsmG [Chloroflexota bacterium]|nr:16S rRNA (guanine(527)-N(7))-methyltransferase RsmG [Chloroflexota bacterium]
MTLAAAAADLFGLALTPDQEALFARYTDELATWNVHTNLTAITEPGAVVVRHYLDSLTLLASLPDRAGATVIDVGSGAGFPGVPLRIVRPDLRVTLLEATGKKIAFLKHLIDLLGLDGVTFANARAEEAGQDPAHRAHYDVAVARAVARMPILLEYLLPLVKVGGLAIAMKGTSAHEESASARRALEILGGRLHAIESFDLPGVEGAHHLVIVEKIAPTPPLYPRRPGLPTQSPLI